MQQNACHRNIKWIFYRFVAMLLLRNKDQQQNNPLATFATHLCRQRRGLEWTASSSLNDTTTVNWLLCSVSFIQAKKLSLQESNQLIGIKIPTSGFSRNIWFLIPISRRRANARFASPALRTPMRSLILFYTRYHKQGQRIQWNEEGFLTNC